MYDCLTAYQCHNMDIPDGITQELYDKILMDVAWYEYYSYTYPTRMLTSKYTVGPLLYLVNQNIQKFYHFKQNSQYYDSPPSLTIFSGHDTG